MTDAIVSEEFYDEFHWDDYGSEAPTAATVRYWRYTTAGGKEYLQSDESSFAAGVHDFTATSLGGGGFQFISASLATGFQGRRIHREARATGPLPSYPVQPWDGFVTANDEDDNAAANAANATHLREIKDGDTGDFIGASHSLKANRDATAAENAANLNEIKTADLGTGATLTGVDTFAIPDSGDPSENLRLRFRFRDATANPPGLFRDPEKQMTGTADITSGLNTVTGTGTAFDTEFVVNDYIRFKDGDGTVHQVASITDATNMTITPVATESLTGKTPIRIRVVLAVEDQSGGSPTGITPQGTPAGFMVRSEPGKFYQDVTVENSDTAVPGTQGFFTASTDDADLAFESGHNVHFIDSAQIDRIEQNTVDIKNDVSAHRSEVEPELDQIKADTAAIRSTDVPAIQSNISNEHATTRSHVTTEHDTTRALITDVQAGTRLRYSWSSVGDAGIDGGRVRFRVNLTDDTGGDISTGDIDISSASATLERSRAAAAFTTTGVTQPTVTKEAGAAIIEFDLVGTEWRPGDEAHLTLKGVKASGRFIPAASWLFQPNTAGTYTPDYST